MEWKNLSDKAKGILEWVENPYTKNRETIEIKIGEGQIMLRVSELTECDLTFTA